MPPLLVCSLWSPLMLGHDVVIWALPTANLTEQKAKSVRKVRENSMEYKNVLFHTALLFQTLHILGIFKS